ncbi:MAG: hypothetical protein AAB426_10510 [Myxococcota bacterium]
MSAPPHGPGNEVQPDAAALGPVAAWVLGFFVFLVVIIVVLVRMFHVEVRNEIFKKQLAPESAQLVSQRAQDAERLGQYVPIDGEAGRYRIPIARAQELIAAEPQRLAAESVRP